MSSKMARFTAVLFLAISAVPLGCATTPPPPPGPALVNAADKAAVDAAMPTVTVVGVVDSVNNGESVLTINFKGTEQSHLYAVILGDSRDTVQAAFGNDLAKAITGKTVHVTGRITLYRGRPEIIIYTPGALVVAG